MEGRAMLTVELISGVRKELIVATRSAAILLVLLPVRSFVVMACLSLKTVN
jgi:hypothetical protein